MSYHHITSSSYDHMFVSTEVECIIISIRWLFLARANASWCQSDHSISLAKMHQIMWYNPCPPFLPRLIQDQPGRVPPQPLKMTENCGFFWFFVWFRIWKSTCSLIFEEKTWKLKFEKREISLMLKKIYQNLSLKNSRNGRIFTSCSRRACMSRGKKGDTKVIRGCSHVFLVKWCVFLKCS